MKDLFDKYGKKTVILAAVGIVVVLGFMLATGTDVPVPFNK